MKFLRALFHPNILFIGMIEALSIWAVLNGLSLWAVLLLDFFFIPCGIAGMRRMPRLDEIKKGDC